AKLRRPARRAGRKSHDRHRRPDVLNAAGVPPASEIFCKSEERQSDAAFRRSRAGLRRGPRLFRDVAKSPLRRKLQAPSSNIQGNFNHESSNARDTFVMFWLLDFPWGLGFEMWSF